LVNGNEWNMHSLISLICKLKPK